MCLNIFILEDFVSEDVSSLRYTICFVSENVCFVSEDVLSLRMFCLGIISQETFCVSLCIVNCMSNW